MASATPEGAAVRHFESECRPVGRRIAVVEGKRRFLLGNMPEGQYDLEVWHEVVGRQIQKIKVETREAATVTLTLRVPLK